MTLKQLTQSCRWPLLAASERASQTGETLGRIVRGRVPAPLRRIVATPAVHGLVVVAILYLLIMGWGGQSYNSYVVQLVAIYAIAALGLNIPAGLGGALSLGQGAAFAVGAYTVAILGASHGWPIWLTLPACLVLGLLVGLMMGAPAGRLGVIGLTMVSLGLTLVASDLLVQLSGLTGGSNGISNIVPLSSFHGQPYSWELFVPCVILGCLFVAYVAHAAYRQSRFGRAALAIRDEPLGATAAGVSPYWNRVLGFAVGAALGGLAGGLFSYLSLFISPDAVSTDFSIQLLVMVVLGGAGSRLGPIIGATILGIVPLWLDKYPHVDSFIYGGLLIALMLVKPKGIVSRTAAPVADPFAVLHEPDGAQERVAEEPAATPDHLNDVVLRASGISRSFGGLAALSGVDLTVRAGEIVGLIGPNGSGKTTMLNVISGLYRPDGGEIELLGRRIDGLGPVRIADMGVGRTFQTPKVFPGLSVAEHLRVAGEHGYGSDGRAGNVRSARAAWDLMRSGGLDPSRPNVLSRQVGTFSHGQLRFLEMAMAVYRSPKLLLLDEPAAGLALSEIEALEAVARRLADSGMAVVIVEHHLDLIRRLVDSVAVLNLGELLWTGTPDQLHETEEVRVAYLGDAV